MTTRGYRADQTRDEGGRFAREAAAGDPPSESSHAPEPAARPLNPDWDGVREQRRKKFDDMRRRKEERRKRDEEQGSFGRPPSPKRKVAPELRDHDPKNPGEGWKPPPGPPRKWQGDPDWRPEPRRPTPQPSPPKEPPRDWRKGSQDARSATVTPAAYNQNHDDKGRFSSGGLNGAGQGDKPITHQELKPEVHKDGNGNEIFTPAYRAFLKSHPGTNAGKPVSDQELDDMIAAGDFDHLKEDGCGTDGECEIKYGPETEVEQDAKGVPIPLWDPRHSRNKAPAAKPPAKGKPKGHHQETDMSKLLEHAEAKGREALAARLAASNMPMDQAIELLASSPRAAAPEPAADKKDPHARGVAAVTLLTGKPR